MLGIRRREFISLFGGAVSWPLAAHAQQPAMPVVGLLNPQSADGYADRLRGFHRGLKELGYVEGDNVTIVYRFAENQLDRLPALAAELVRRQVAVIASTGATTPALAVKSATTTIPVVFLVGEDPVRLGLVASLARPGGNLTGVNFFNNELTAKRLELLRELAPGASRVAMLVNPNNPNAEGTMSDAAVAANAMGLQIRTFKASTTGEINATFAAFGRERPDALFVAGDSFFTGRRVQLTHLATLHKLPATYGSREFVEAGGLMSYGSNLPDSYRQVGVYVGRILQGAKPADLPVMQASKFEFILNLQTARTLGFEVSPTLLAQADEVIE
jgi:putative ABC transport system substrate-binding protein